jgi:hypothetical protein
VTDKDDRATIWMDLDGDGQFEINGDKGEEMLGGIENFTSDWVELKVSDGPFKIAVAHGEWGGWFKIKTLDYDTR